MPSVFRQSGMPQVNREIMECCYIPLTINNSFGTLLIPNSRWLAVSRSVRQVLGSHSGTVAKKHWSGCGKTCPKTIALCL